jgi:transposase
MEAGKKAPCTRYGSEANSDEVKGLHQEAHDLKEVVAEQALEPHLLKKV